MSDQDLPLHSIAVTAIAERVDTVAPTTRRDVISLGLLLKAIAVLSVLWWVSIGVGNWLMSAQYVYSVTGQLGREVCTLVFGVSYVELFVPGLIALAGIWIVVRSALASEALEDKGI